MRDVAIPTLQDRLQDLWDRRLGRDGRARQSVRAVARRLGPVLAATGADLRPTFRIHTPQGPGWTTLRLTWDADGTPELQGRSLSGHLRLALSQALHLQPREIRALALHSPPRGTLQGHGPWTLWIGDARHVPHDSPIGPQWLPGPPPHSRDGTEIRIGADGAILPSS